MFLLFLYFLPYFATSLSDLHTYRIKGRINDWSDCMCYFLWRRVSRLHCNSQCFACSPERKQFILDVSCLVDKDVSVGRET